MARQHSRKENEIPGFIPLCVRPGRLATPNFRNWSQLKGRWKES